MNAIQLSTEIAAPFATLRSAISTRDGFRAWFSEDTRVDAVGRYTFSFGTRAVTFTLDRADVRGIAMSCVHEQNNPDWLGTVLTISLTPVALGKTRVELVHAGYPSKNECYERCIEGWTYFLSSLAEYATNGNGKPFRVQVAAPGPAAGSTEVAS
jgi:uncharacterized protein YndB with AHSA1/START domain